MDICNVFENAIQKVINVGKFKVYNKEVSELAIDIDSFPDMVSLYKPTRLNINRKWKKKIK
jgi:hypothetical protein